MAKDLQKNLRGVSFLYRGFKNLINLNSPSVKKLLLVYILFIIVILISDQLYS